MQDSISKSFSSVPDMQGQIASIRNMTGQQLLDYVVVNPRYLLYPFYKDLAAGIRDRCSDLKASSIPPRGNWYWDK